MTLNLEANIKDADDFYEKLLRIHDGLSDEDSAALTARLILILANHIGDKDVLEQAFEVAQRVPT